jgi:nitrite reductase/ring-hydroxylating ferredoxin subunit
LSRGIVGSVGEHLVVASPIYKQHFCLQTGACMEDNVNLRTWSVRVTGKQLQVAN